MSSAAEGTCAVCGTAAARQCANCRTTRYCSRQHQRAHWVEHRPLCRPYIVAVSPTLGRHWVATRDVAAGEVLLEERPLVAGPKAASPPVCLVCYATPPAGRGRCADCGWPVCGTTTCRTSPAHRAECSLIAGHYTGSGDENHRRTATYSFVLPLRCLLLADHCDRVAFRSLQSHLDARLDTPLYRVYAVNVASFVLDRLGLRSAGHDERSVLEAAAVLDTNAFEVRRDGRKFRALYAAASMMAHSCTANTKHVFFGDENAIRVVAAVPIGRGQPITATYTQTLWCTRDRRRHLWAAKCFRCECRRCNDPTELATNIGSDACQACTAGRLSPGHPECDRCGHQQSDADRSSLERCVDDAERRVRAIGKTDCAGFELFLEQVRANAVPPLHADHYVAVGVKYALVQLYSDRISDLSTKQLKNNTSLCEELLRLADILEPGLTKFRGILLFYVVQGLKRLKQMKAKRNYDEIIKNYSIEAAVILKTEPDLVHLVDRLLL